MSKKIITAIIALAAVCGGAVAQPKMPIVPHRTTGMRAKWPSLTRRVSEYGMPSMPTT